MLDAATLTAWLVAQPGVPDRQGRPIRRPESAARVIAQVAVETEAPYLFAVHLDVLAARESGYRLTVIGDGGKSCGAYQTPCARTPSDALGQTRLALAILRTAIGRCAEHPVWMYASGHCSSSSTALEYEALIRQELHAAPVDGVLP
jgi:hypothetical protein